MACKLVLFFLLVGLASSSSMTNDGFEHLTATGRSLLQQKASCPVNFENENYTIITSQCKGPNYNKTMCCDAFKQFACPHSNEINDLKTDCADTMFSYINLFGKYPPGLFANMCTVSSTHDGVKCDDFEQLNAQKSDATLISAKRVMIVASLLLIAAADLIH